MKKKNEIGLAVLLAGIAAVAGWFILRAWVWVSEEIFGINLVENGEQVISDREIASYNRTSHEIRLTEEGARKIEALSFEVPVYGKPFVVKLSGREIYNGSFWSPISSAPPPGIAIGTFVQGNTIRITNLESLQGVDPRNNSEIFDHFERAARLTQ